jgi:hypothetical protein
MRAEGDEMALDTLRLIRNILFRSLAIGVVMVLLMYIATVAGWQLWTTLVAQLFRTDEAHLIAAVLGLFTAVKFYFVFVLLVPGLAIQWTIRSELARRK